MGQLTNQYVSQSYQGLLKLDDSTTGVTGTLQYVQDGVGNNLPIQVSTSSVSITGSFFGDGSGLTGVTAVVDSGSLVTTSSFNAYTSSNDSRVNSLISQTGSYVTETESGSFVTNVQQGIINNIVEVIKGNGITSQFTIDNVVSSSFADNATSASYAPSNPLPAGIVSGSQQIVDLGFATTSSVNSLSQSIAVTDLAQNGRLTSLETATGSLQSQINQKLDSSSFNSYTSSNDAKVNSLIGVTGSYATTGSNTFNGDQTISTGYKLIVDEINPNGSAINITGSLNVTNEITALSASITY